MAESLSMGNNHAEARLDKIRHIKYWTRCLKTLLPTQYTSNDSNRMCLAYFTIAALDLLDSLDISTPAERHDHINWIYRCQHPNGGFRMWPGTDLGPRANAKNAKWDPANVPATYFALATLLMMGDDFKRVRRRATLDWIRRMQRKDGTFGETLVDGRIEGGRDPRFGYCAAGVPYMLHGRRADGQITLDAQVVPDVDVDSFVRCVRASQSYDGGIADEAYHEPHAGYTFCAVGALSFLGRLDNNRSASNANTAPVDRQGVLRWLSARQTDLLDPDGDFDTEFIGNGRNAKPTSPTTLPTTSRPPDSVMVEPLHQSPTASSPFSLVGPDPILASHAGMNGRTNKVADTCYAFWVSASLRILGAPTLYDAHALRRYLLEKTQHPVLGGFGKFPGDLPDLYHSYLGLAALALTGSSEVKELDAGMCVSREARERLERIWEDWEDG